jgi:pyruvate-formate lyase-activating enzyme
MNVVGSYLYHLLSDSPRRWYPLLGVYYLTYGCDFRCPYCSDGAGQPYYRLRSPVLPASQVIKLLKIMRQHCEYLVLTGGEPLQHPEVAAVLAELPQAKFRGIILTTNGYALAPVLPQVAAAVQYLVFGLQTLNPARADAWYGQNAHQQILENLELAAQYPGRKFEIIISSVVTPENIGDLYELYQYAKGRGFRLAACPQLVGVKAHPALAGHAEYRKFYDFLIAEKKRGGHIQGTVDYLEYLRDLRKFACRPFTMLVVAPGGEVFYPCLELGQFAGNLFTEPNLHRLRQIGCKRFGPQPACDTRCHSACALGFARLLQNPASLAHEAFLLGRQFIQNGLCQGAELSR